MIVAGAGILAFSQGMNLLEVIGGCLIGWPILFIIFLNLFLPPYE
jgi:hypothetical protein